MTLIEDCVAGANAFAVILGACACILQAYDSYEHGDRFRFASRLMLQAMWIVALTVFSYFHVTMERTHAVINTPQFLFHIMVLLFFVGPFMYCPIFTFIYWMFTD